MIAWKKFTNSLVRLPKDAPSLSDSFWKELSNWPIPVSEKNSYFELKKLVEELEDDVTKVYTKNNKAAAVRVRKTLQEVKNISQKLRLEINENRKQWD